MDILSNLAGAFWCLVIGVMGLAFTWSRVEAVSRKIQVRGTIVEVFVRTDDDDDSYEQDYDPDSRNEKPDFMIWAEARLSERELKKLEELSDDEIHSIEIVEYVIGNEFLREAIVKSKFGGTTRKVGSSADLLVTPKDPSQAEFGSVWSNISCAVIALPFAVVALIICVGLLVDLFN
ncbi:hypothetical protein IT575_13020 [bacterium]|nr:hypothetical protein [bacterium]